MKKPYNKPEILFEDFSLSSSITAGCDLDTPLPSYEQNCGYPTRGGTVFVDGAQCTTTPQDGMFEGFCYHNPTDMNNLFNS